MPQISVQVPEISVQMPQAAFQEAPLVSAQWEEIPFRQRRLLQRVQKIHQTQPGYWDVSAMFSYVDLVDLVDLTWCDHILTL